MHSTSNLEDGYFGSGKRLKYSIQKHGKSNHSKEILEFLKNKELLINREIQLVTVDLLTDPMCMNLKPGGTGGLCNIEHAYKFHAAGGKKVFQNFNAIHLDKIKNDPGYKEKVYDAIAKTHFLKTGSANGWKGKSHSIESKNKIGLANSIQQRGSKNSQFGKIWIHNEIENKIIKKEDIEHFIAGGWIKGRINKNKPQQ
jgi:hypothetical protein